MNDENLTPQEVAAVIRMTTPDPTREGQAHSSAPAGSAFALRRVGFAFPLPSLYMTVAEAEAARFRQAHHHARDLEIVAVRFQVVTPNEKGQR